MTLRSIRHWALLFLAVASFTWLARADTVEFTIYHPVSTGAGGTHADELAIGSTYSSETPGDGSLIVADRLGIGTTSPAGPLHVVGVDDTTSYVIFKEGANTAAAGTPEIRVGLGTDDPQEQLHLTGNLRLPPTTVDYGYKAGVIYTDPEGSLNHYIHGDGVSGTFIGRGAGNLVVDSAIARNVGIGRSALCDPDYTGSDNTAVGGSALSFNEDGQWNVVVGDSAMAYNLSGTSNTALGLSALNSNTTGNSNVALGYNALVQNTTGSFNTAVGVRTLTQSADGERNVAVGANALRDNQAVGSNVAVGAGALASNTTGEGNVAVGIACLGRNSTADHNTGIGRFALWENTTGSENSVLSGWEGGKDNTTGSSNTGAGCRVLYRNTTASDQVALGGMALGNSALGDGSVGIGQSALAADQAGPNNVVIGYEAGKLACGAGCVFIGNWVGRSEMDSEQLHIDNSSTDTPLICGEFTDGSELVTVNHNLGVGTATFGTGAVGVLAIANGAIPTSSPADQIQLYAQDVDQGGGTMRSELYVRDEAGNPPTKLSDPPLVAARLTPGIPEDCSNVTALSPHNFSLIPGGPSEPMAWSFYSERGDTAINVDMLRVVRLVEQISGEHLVYLKDLKAGQYFLQLADMKELPSIKQLSEQVATVGAEQRAFEQELAAQEEDLRLIQEMLTGDGPFGDTPWSAIAKRQ